MAGASRIADARMNGARRLARPRVAGGRGNRGSRGGFSGAHRRGGDEELRELCWWWVVVERRRRLVGQWKHKLEWASNGWAGKGNAHAQLAQTALDRDDHDLSDISGEKKSLLSLPQLSQKFDFHPSTTKPVI